MKVGVLGSGKVAQVLASGFLQHGHNVMIGSRDAAKVQGWLASTAGKGRTGSFEEAAAFGEMVVLAVKGTAAESLIQSLVPHLKDKTVIDVNNPIAEEPPVNGVLKFFTGPNDSLMERLQKIAPAAKFVKAFSCVGNASMVHPKFPGGVPTMFICGNDAGAKQQVVDILKQFGWEWEDMGMAEAARAIEPLCMLWCIPGLRGGTWTHAFKMLKM